MPTIKLQSSDGEVFTVDQEIVKHSGLISPMLDDDDEDDVEEVVLLPNVTGAILKKVIQWANFHKDDEAKECRTEEICSWWDKNFLKVEQETLFELILAANYLDMKGLLDVTCKALANLLKGKSTEEIRKIFNIQNDFTPSEEEEVRNEWCGDE